MDSLSIDDDDDDGMHWNAAKTNDTTTTPQHRSTEGHRDVTG